MRKLKLYLDTSVWSFFYADDAPEKKDVTKEFFDLAKRDFYEVYISEAVLDEINGSPENIRARLTALVKKFSPIELELTQEVKELSRFYSEREIVPEKKITDALHVAVATVNELDALVTWNYRHLANLRKEELFHGASLEKGYFKKVEIVTPMEVLSDEIR